MTMSTWKFLLTVGRLGRSLSTPSGTDANPVGSNLGWGYTGCSGGSETGMECSPQWIQEKVDLSAYAGQKILVRFEYITDAALNYESLMLDDIHSGNQRHLQFRERYLRLGKRGVCASG
jgi:bacillopeptidase F (M6 metalloprotease family)